MARLPLVLGLMGLVPTQAHAAAFCAATEPTPASVVQRVEASLGPAPVATLGPLALTLVGELQGQLCSDPMVLSLLPNTCTPFQGDVAVIRARLVTDLLALPRGALSTQLATLPPEQRVALAYLSAVSVSVEPREVAHRVANALGIVGEECVSPRVSAGDPVGLAAALAWDLSGDWESTQTPEGARAVVMARFTAARGTPPAPVEEPFVQALTVQSAQVFAWHSRLRTNPADPKALEQLLLAEFTLLQRALALTHARELALPPEAWSLLGAVLAGNLDGALDTLRAWLVSRAQLDAAVLDAATTALRFARARSQEEAERIVRGAVLGLGPWSDAILFSASGGIPQLESSNFNVIGEGMLGYHAETWGLSGGGGAAIIEFESDDYVASTGKFSGNGDAWLAFPLNERTHFDARASFDGAVFDGDTTMLGDVGVNGEETNLLLRGSALAGLRHQTSDFAVGGWLGGGFQFEWYDLRATDLSDANETQLDETQSTSATFQGRARLQWGFVPRVLALRVSVDGKMYSISRMSESIDTTMAGEDALTNTDDAALQLEAIGRAFVDLELLRVMGFVPAAGVGIDHYQLAVDGQETLVTTIPVYMLGIRRATF